MTRTIRVRNGSLLHRALTVPLVTTTSTMTVIRSRFCWSPAAGEPYRAGGVTVTPIVYELRLTGILHALLGVALIVDGPNPYTPIDEMLKEQP